MFQQGVRGYECVPVKSGGQSVFQQGVGESVCFPARSKGISLCSCKE